MKELVFQCSAPDCFTVLLRKQPVMNKRGETSSIKAGGFMWQVRVINTFCVWCPVIHHDRYLTSSLTQERRP